MPFKGERNVLTATLDDKSCILLESDTNKRFFFKPKGQSSGQYLILLKFINHLDSSALF